MTRESVQTLTNPELVAQLITLRRYGTVGSPADTDAVLFEAARRLGAQS